MIRTHHTRSARTIHPQDREVDAWNAALEELGIEWRLDAAVYTRHKDIADTKARLCACIEAQYPHLLKAYDRDFIGSVVSEVTALQARGIGAGVHH